MRCSSSKISCPFSLTAVGRFCHVEQVHPEEAVDNGDQNRSFCLSYCTKRILQHKQCNSFDWKLFSLTKVTFSCKGTIWRLGPTNINVLTVVPVVSDSFAHQQVCARKIPETYTSTAPVEPFFVLGPSSIQYCARRKGDLVSLGGEVEGNRLFQRIDFCIDIKQNKPC